MKTGRRVQPRKMCAPSRIHGRFPKKHRPPSTREARASWTSNFFHPFFWWTLRVFSWCIFYSRTNNFRLIAGLVSICSRLWYDHGRGEGCAKGRAPGWFDYPLEELSKQQNGGDAVFRHFFFFFFLNYEQLPGVVARHRRRGGFKLRLIAAARSKYPNFVIALQPNGCVWGCSKQLHPRVEE